MPSKYVHFHSSIPLHWLVPTGHYLLSASLGCYIYYSARDGEMAPFLQRLPRLLLLLQYSVILQLRISLLWAVYFPPTQPSHRCSVFIQAIEFRTFVHWGCHCSSLPLCAFRKFWSHSRQISMHIMDVMRKPFFSVSRCQVGSRPRGRRNATTML